ncbi:phosphatidylinositol-3,5-bisphosphate 3-phosphatase MTMR4 isoform X2 [Microcaecilia unicolor]|uniref:phosphatidylinositol-3,5-bisphosphate 3-phosphatase n=1 Tax=Microcaecilia unicolor TaxID=1415580 RepID=A0A6P7ZVV1_9AMPH|nr:myotubularin-related protein 4 isoform X2 [Microcaecilia unicolor]XP_030077939.1 myotubularin-related protein 4 isoform X2 [Microcaecilia unicolor]
MLEIMGEEGPPSLEYIQAKDLFPQKELVKEEENLQVPFPVLQGEAVEYLGRASDSLIAISNYRLHIKFKDSVVNVPLRIIEAVESRDMFQLQIICKDSKVIRCHFSTFKQCQEWLRRLSRATMCPGKQEDLFAFAYHAWCLGVCADEEDQHAHLCRPGDHVKFRFEMELVRMGFDLQNAWRASDINSSYKLCPSYPQKLLVPVWITDKELENVASFRSWKRIPVVVYRHLRNGAVIARCSQPEISWWGWRNADDEYLVTSIAKACVLNPGTKMSAPSPKACSSRNAQGSRDNSDAGETDFDSLLTSCSGVESGVISKKLLILDARSYTAAVANRAKGGGCECEEYYPNCEVVFMGMANIHSIRNSFQYLRAVCSQMPDPGNWLSALESTKWMQHLSIMLKAATLVCNAVEREGRPVLVHCSDGWDRTPQIVSLAKILLDPYYRTLEGFQVLVEMDWLDFGHKFGDRCGHQEKVEDQNELCPVFLQWLDCVHQLLLQFPCLFEFNEAFLVKLVQHTYSCLYGTFLANNACEREMRNIYKRTCSVWSLLRTENKNFYNLLYTPASEMRQILHPVCHVRALHLWTAVYLPISSPCTPAEDSMDHFLPPMSQSQDFSVRLLDRMPKTRSVDDLLSACDSSSFLTRTSSDPNLNNHCQETRVSSESCYTSSERPEAHAPTDPSISMGLQGTLLDQDEYVGMFTVDPVLKDIFNGLPSTIPEIPSPSRGSTDCEQRLGEEDKLKEEGLAWRIGMRRDIQKPAQMCNLMARDVIAKHQNEDPLTECSKRNVSSRHKDPGKGTSGRDDDVAQSGITGKGPMELRTYRHQVSQSQISDFSLLGSNWESLPGLASSVPSGDVGRKRPQAPGCCKKILSSRQLKLTGTCMNGHPSPREGLQPYSPLPTSMLCAKSCSHRSFWSWKQAPSTKLLAPALPSPMPPGYLDDDGLPFPVDMVQQRLRQIEATYKQEVEVLRRQVRELQLRLEIHQSDIPLEQPQLHYEDDFTCLKESESSDTEDFFSDQSEDHLSEASWEPVDKRETEVTRWVPDHMATHCFNCDCEFWLAKRRHHCRNCGNVFCASCCHLKLPIPDQQLYNPVLVCNSCYDHIQVSRARELMNQQLKKPIATASS